METGIEDSPLCPYCGYSWRGVESDVCPECGKGCPDPFGYLPADALLPWERHIDRPQVWRFLRTLAYGILHYIGYLRTLCRRPGAPIYQARSLAAWMLLGVLPIAVVIPILVSAVRLVHNSGYSLRGLWLGPWVALRVGIVDMWWQRVPSAGLLLVEIVLTASILYKTMRAPNVNRNFWNAICCLGPGFLAFAAADQLMSEIVGELCVTWNWAPGILLDHGLAVLPALGVGACVWLALRVACRAGWGRALVAGTLVFAIVGMAEGWVLPFLADALWSLRKGATVTYFG